MTTYSSNHRNFGHRQILLGEGGSGGAEGSGFESVHRQKFSAGNFSVFTQNFRLQLSATPSLDDWLFFSHIFPLLLSLSFISCTVCLSHTHLFFLPSSSLLNSYASYSKLTNGLFSVSAHYHCLCWDPAIRTKLVLCF